MSFIHVQEQKSSGTAANTILGSGWSTRKLNTTVYNDIPTAYLDTVSNPGSVWLPSGSYKVFASAGACGSHHHRIVLQDNTNGVNLLLGTSEDGDLSVGATTTNRSHLMGIFVVPGPDALTEIVLRHFFSSITGGETEGTPTSSLLNEVYSDMMIEKL